MSTLGERISKGPLYSIILLNDVWFLSFIFVRNQRIDEWRNFTEGCGHDNHKAVVDRFRQLGTIFEVDDDHNTGIVIIGVVLKLIK